jgi:PRTRC genetic system protein A
MTELNIAGYRIYHGPGTITGKKGRHYDYVMARNGLLISASSQHLAATLPVCHGEVRGLGQLNPGVHLVHGKIPASILHRAVVEMRLSLDREVYVSVVWERNRYMMHIPEQEGGPGKVTYQREPNTVLQMHSHPQMPGRFSAVDDLDEAGLGLFGVIGRLGNVVPEFGFRVGIYGHFGHLRVDDVFGS